MRTHINTHTNTHKHTIYCSTHQKNAHACSHVCTYVHLHRHALFCAAPTNSRLAPPPQAYPPLSHDAHAHLHGPAASSAEKALPHLLHPQRGSTPSVSGAAPASSVGESFQAPKGSRPQLLVCHDMCGGYTEDR